MEHNKFYYVKELDSIYYKLVPIEKVGCHENKNKITYHKVLNNTFSKKDKITKNLNTPYSVPVNVNTSKNSKNTKTEKSKKNSKNVKTVLSSVNDFDILHRFLKKLKLKRINLLFEKLKMFKKQKKHIFFYFKHSKIFLILKKHVFKHGLVLLKSIISNRVHKDYNKKRIKKFYNLLIN